MLSGICSLRCHWYCCSCSYISRAKAPCSVIQQSRATDHVSQDFGTLAAKVSAFIWRWRHQWASRHTTVANSTTNWTSTTNTMSNASTQSMVPTMTKERTLLSPEEGLENLTSCQYG